MGNYAFSYCSSLTNVIIGNSVTTIEDRVFFGCKSLSSVTITGIVSAIGTNVFYQCPLSYIFIYSPIPPKITVAPFEMRIYDSAELHVPVGTKGAYASVSGWSMFINIIDDLTGEPQPILSHDAVTMGVDEVFQLGVYNTETKVVWASSNPSVAYANECGLVVAMGVLGSTIITATVDGQELECEVTVNSITHEMRVKAYGATETPVVEPTNIIVESIGGNPLMVNARLGPVGASTVIDWSSSDENVAKVENGLVTVVDDGDVVFGAETANSLSHSLKVSADDIKNSGITEIRQGNNAISDNNVYDLTGRCVIVGATPEQINNLSAGVYINNNTKVLVK